MDPLCHFCIRVHPLPQSINHGEELMHPNTYVHEDLYGGL